MAKKRGNNEGSITRRKDGLWVAQVTIGRDPTTGKMKRVTLYGKTRQEAAEKLTQALHAVGQGTFVQSNRLTLGTWLHTWVWEYKRPTLRPVTFDSYERLNAALTGEA